MLGNRFTILVEDPVAGAMDLAGPIAAALEARGLPNFFWAAAFRGGWGQRPAGPGGHDGTGGRGSTGCGVFYCPLIRLFCSINGWPNAFGGVGSKPF